ncbi:hypothetical protein P8452_32256 [Trifolium repens]|nr:hypothetical protein P8452_32256 [Trifolium repens]
MKYLEKNSRADLLSKLASTKKPGNNRTVIQETILKLSTEIPDVLMVVEEEDWRAPVVQYLRNETLPPEKDEANKLKKAAVHYVLVGDKLYKRGFSTPLLLCVSEMEAQRILKEIHDGSCGNHIGGRSLAGKVIRAGFFWPTILRDASSYVRSCDACQRHANLHHAPGEPLKTVMSPWPFYMWGVDILGPFPATQSQVKFLLVAVDYFTKWVEAKPVATISAEKFTSEAVIQFCEEKGIRNTFVSVEHPQANGQAESANKVILKAIKRKLTKKDRNWAEPLPEILWAYHTTI